MPAPAASIRIERAFREVGLRGAICYETSDRNGRAARRRDSRECPLPRAGPARRAGGRQLRPARRLHAERSYAAPLRGGEPIARRRIPRARCRRRAATVRRSAACANAGVLDERALAAHCVHVTGGGADRAGAPRRQRGPQSAIELQQRGGDRQAAGPDAPRSPGGTRAPTATRRACGTNSKLHVTCRRCAPAIRASAVRGSLRRAVLEQPRHRQARSGTWRSAASNPARAPTSSWWTTFRPRRSTATICSAISCSAFPTRPCDSLMVNGRWVVRDGHSRQRGRTRGRGKRRRLRESTVEEILRSHVKSTVPGPTYAEMLHPAVAGSRLRARRAGSHQPVQHHLARAGRRRSATSCCPRN